MQLVDACFGTSLCTSSFSVIQLHSRIFIASSPSTVCLTQSSWVPRGFEHLPSYLPSLDAISQRLSCCFSMILILFVRFPDAFFADAAPISLVHLQFHSKVSKQDSAVVVVWNIHTNSHCKARARARSCWPNSSSSLVLYSHQSCGTAAATNQHGNCCGPASAPDTSYFLSKLLPSLGNASRRNPFGSVHFSNDHLDSSGSLLAPAPPSAQNALWSPCQQRFCSSMIPKTASFVHPPLKRTSRLSRRLRQLDLTRSPSWNVGRLHCLPVRLSFLLNVRRLFPIGICGSHLPHTSATKKESGVSFQDVFPACAPSRS